MMIRKCIIPRVHLFCAAGAALLFLLMSSPLLLSAEEVNNPGDVSSGEQIFKKRACVICHSVSGQGGIVGPDLTQVGIRRSEDWLSRWLDDPSEVLPGTDMPTFEWVSDQEKADLIAYLVSLRKPVDSSTLLRLPTREEAGKRLVEAYDCRACHRIGDGGRGRYPDLTHVGSKIYPEWETNWLKNPQAVKAGTYMPTFPLSEEEREAIAAHLHTLK